jgi:hypothetical protein
MLPPGDRRRLRFVAALFALLAAWAANAPAHPQPTVEELKAKLGSAKGRERPRLCVEIAERQLDAADKLYASDDIEKAQAPLTDVATYSELARDYAIQTHKREKQTEIAVRAMARRLTDILHTLPTESQGSMKTCIVRLERVRDDLLAAMFPKGAK